MLFAVGTDDAGQVCDTLMFADEIGARIENSSINRIPMSMETWTSPRSPSVNPGELAYRACRAMKSSGYIISLPGSNVKFRSLPNQHVRDDPRRIDSP